MGDDPKPIDVRMLAADVQDLLLADILGPKMTRFCLLNLGNGWPGGKTRWDVSTYVSDGHQYHISLLGHVSNDGEVVRPGAMIHTDTGMVVGNAVSLLRQIYLRDNPLRSPESAAKEFVGSLVEPPDWNKVELCTLTAVRFEDIMPSFADNHLIDEWLYERTIGLLYAPRSSYKSFLALDMLLTLAGRLGPWYGFDTRPTGALYVAAEGAEGMKQRVHAFRKTHGLEDTKLPFYLVSHNINLLDPHQTDLLIKVIKECQEDDEIGIVGIDTLAKTMRGGDENNFSVVSAYLENIERIRDECSVTVLIVAHAGKDVGRGARGHSALEADVDFVIRCVRDEETGVAVAEVVKQKDGPDGATLHFKLRQVEIGTSPTGRPKTSGVLEVAHPDEATKSRLAIGPDQEEYDALTNVLITLGRKVHLDGVPSSAVTVTVEEWLEEVIKRDIRPSRETWKEADNKAWYRSRKRLRDKDLIRIYNDVVWLYRTPAEVAAS